MNFGKEDLIIPLIAYVNKINKNKNLIILLITLLINTSLIPYLMNYIRSYKIIWPYNYNHGYIIYLFYGYIIHNYKFNSKFKFIF